MALLKQLKNENKEILSELYQKVKMGMGVGVGRGIVLCSLLRNLPRNMFLSFLVFFSFSRGVRRPQLWWEGGSMKGTSPELGGASDA